MYTEYTLDLIAITWVCLEHASKTTANIAAGNYEKIMLSSWTVNQIRYIPLYGFGKQAIKTHMKMRVSKQTEHTYQQ